MHQSMRVICVKMDRLISAHFRAHFKERLAGNFMSSVFHDTDLIRFLVFFIKSHIADTHFNCLVLS